MIPRRLAIQLRASVRVPCVCSVCKGKNDDLNQFADSTLGAGGAVCRRVNAAQFPMNGPALPPPQRREQVNRSLAPSVPSAPSASAAPAAAAAAAAAVAAVAAASSSSSSSSDNSRYLTGAGSGVPLGASAAPSSANKQDSPTSSSGYGSPDSGLIDER